MALIIVSVNRSDHPQTKTGQEQALETLLRTLLYIVTHRILDGIGYYDPAIVASVPTFPDLFPVTMISTAATASKHRDNGDEEENSAGGDLDESLEVNYAQLIDDVIHLLCINPMSHSELIDALPKQHPVCLLRKAPPFHVPMDKTTETGNQGGRDYQDSDRLERPLARVLKTIATQTTVGQSGKKVYVVRPEVVLNRFDRFYPGYKQSKQTSVSAARTYVVDKPPAYVMSCFYLFNRPRTMSRGRSRSGFPNPITH